MFPYEEVEDHCFSSLSCHVACSVTLKEHNLVHTQHFIVATYYAERSEVMIKLLYWRDCL